MNPDAKLWKPSWIRDSPHRHSTDLTENRYQMDSEKMEKFAIFTHPTGPTTVNALSMQ